MQRFITSARQPIRTPAPSLGLLVAWLFICGQPTAWSQPPQDGAKGNTFYVDSENGRDDNTGRSEEAAWRSLERVNAAALKPGDSVCFKSGGLWRGSLAPASGDSTGPVTYTSYGSGPKPLILGSRSRSRPEDWVEVQETLWATLPKEAASDAQPESPRSAGAAVADSLAVDVGNIIFDHGKVCGWKKWSIAELEKPYDYYYDPSSWRIFLRCPANPATRHQSIELALKRHVVDQANAHHLVYDGLAVKYGAAHGFGGGNTHHLVIRNCDLGYIGGGHQLTRPGGRPVRYGNAIEFWGAAHDNLVEGCRIWEVYDAALTNQGRSPSSKQVNITYRNNLIRNCEYSFEYWNHPETALTQNIRFVNNTCVDAGSVWSHAQRPDPNGSHLMFYSNTAATSGIEIKYNVFCNVTEWGSRYSSGWKTLPEMDYNLWYGTRGVMANWFGRKIESFEEYRRTTGLDANSLFADPKFVDPANGDYRLAPDSPARQIRPDGGPMGQIQG
jgi:hypothetical protein